MDRGVARARIAQRQIRRQIAAKPIRGGFRLDFSEAFPGAQMAVALQTLKTAGMEQYLLVEITNWIERKAFWFHFGNVESQIGFPASMRL